MNKNPSDPSTREGFLLCLMIDAYEHGIGYWAMSRYTKQDEYGNYLSFEVRDMEEGDAPGKLAREPGIGNSRSWHLITPQILGQAIERILRGEIKIARRVAAQFVGYPGNVDMCDYDSEGADCAVQVAAFGELVFG